MKRLRLFCWFPVFLAGILANAAYLPSDPCLCSTEPAVAVSRNGHQVIRFTLHHGNRLRLQGFGPFGDYFIGQETGQAIQDLIDGKSPATD